MMKYRNGAMKINPFFDDLEIPKNEDSGQGFLHKVGHFFKDSRETKLKKDTSYYVTWGWFEDFILNSFFRVEGKADGENKKLIFPNL